MKSTVTYGIADQSAKPSQEKLRTKKIWEYKKWAIVDAPQISKMLGTCLQRDGWSRIIPLSVEI